MKINFYICIVKQSNNPMIDLSFMKLMPFILISLLLSNCDSENSQNSHQELTINQLYAIDVDHSGNDCFGEEIGKLNDIIATIDYDSSLSTFIVYIPVTGTIDGQVVLIDCQNTLFGNIGEEIIINGTVAQTGYSLMSPIAGVKHFSFKQ